MESNPRPSSSVYSGEDETKSGSSSNFSLQDILRRLSVQEKEQQTHTMRALEHENAILVRELQEARSEFTVVYKLVWRASRVANHVMASRRSVSRRIEKQRCIWLANCTVI